MQPCTGNNVSLCQLQSYTNEKVIETNRVGGSVIALAGRQRYTAIALAFAK